MEYQFLDAQAKVNGILNRLSQLEQEHYTAVLLLGESEAINSKGDVEALRDKLASLEVRIQHYREMLVGQDESADQD